MAKTNAERKAAQRERQRLAGIVPVEIKLDQQEAEMLRENCVARRPQREPYDLDEYITMLIRKDNAELKSSWRHGINGAAVSAKTNYQVTQQVVISLVILSAGKPTDGMKPN